MSGAIEPLWITILTGARDGAVASFKLKHVHLEDEHVVQDAREVNTKFSKTFTTWFFPVGIEARQAVGEWIKGASGRASLRLTTPFSGNSHGARDGWQVRGRRARSQALEHRGFNPDHLQGCVPARRAALFEPPCASENSGAAWAAAVPDARGVQGVSQNLGHEGVLTTFTSYGEVASARQAEILRELGQPGPARTSVPEDLRRMLLKIANGEAVTTLGCLQRDRRAAFATKVALRLSFSYVPLRWIWSAKQAILDFVSATTDQASPSYVRPEERVATFDQDGTCGSSIRCIRRWLSSALCVNAISGP